MKIIIEDGKASEVYFNNKFYPTNKEIEVDFSEGLRLSQIFSTKINQEEFEYDSSVFNVECHATMLTHIDTTSGWGNVGVNLIKYSAPYFDTSLVGRVLGSVPREITNAKSREVNPHSALIIHEQPKQEWLDMPFKKKICIVPFETTRIPASWVSTINACSALIVPCRQNKQAFADSGVSIPIEVVPWGTDTEKFYKIDRPKKDIFTFGHMGSLSKRKGTDMMVRAFLKAFPTEKDVKLICKTSNNHFMWSTRDPRVKIDISPVPHDELMSNFFKEIDCFVFPTRGEGWGLPISEAMSTGAPVIVTNWSGPADFVTEEVGWLLNYKMVPAEDFTKTVYKEDCGDWAEPDEEQLIELMRYAYTHQDEVKEKGEKAAKWIRDRFTWNETIKHYVSALKKHL